MSNRFLTKYMPLREGEGAGAGGAAGGAAGAGAAGAGAAPPWHAGVEAETLGFWQNKGLDVADPKTVATGLTKFYRDAEKFIGVPPDQLIRMPKADAKPEDLKAFYQRLGAPADPKEYDFNGIKFGGNDLEASFADSMRAALAAAYVPKDKAGTIVGAVVKYLEDADAAESAVSTAKIAEEKAALAKNWGTAFEYNKLKAMEGAQRLGITPEAVALMEKSVGYAAVMEAMRKVGVGTSEDTFVDRGAGGQGKPVTREGAIARKSELMADKAWSDRYLKGGVQERQEMDALNIMIDGQA